MIISTGQLIDSNVEWKDLNGCGVVIPSSRGKKNVGWDGKIYVINMLEETRRET